MAATLSSSSTPTRAILWLRLAAKARNFLVVVKLKIITPFLLVCKEIITINNFVKLTHN